MITGSLLKSDRLVLTGDCIETD